MSKRQISGPEFIKLESEGEFFEGKLTKIDTTTANTRTVPRAWFEGDDGLKHTMILGTVLADLITPDLYGQTLQIAFTGIIKPEGKGNEYNTYDVFIID